MILTIPKWVPNELYKVAPILDKIAPWRLVGGIVRDIILNKPTADIDIAIAAPPQQVLQQLLSYNIRAIPTGIKHGTITVYINKNIRFEITSLRKDEKCHGRHATVSFTNDWKLDSQRRDFTINAMSLDMHGNLHDYFNGYNHLKDKKLVFVGSPTQRIKEDYLRALRYWRFIAILGTRNIDVESQNAAIYMFKKIDCISGERIKSEMFKLLSSPFALETINIMVEQKILEHLNLNLKTPINSFTNNPLLNLALMLRKTDINQQEQNISRLCNRWRLSNNDKNTLLYLCFPNINIDWQASLEEHQKYIFLLGKEKYQNMVLLAQAEGFDASKYQTSLLNFTPPKFPITGHDVMDFPPKKRGDILKKTMKYWVDKSFKPNKDDLLIFINQLYYKQVDR